MALSLSAAAQIDEPVEYDFRGRISAEIDKRIVSGFHISLSEEFRMKDNFTAVDRFYTSLGLSYKPCPYFKLGLSYTLMNIHDWSSDSESWSWKMRHRTSLDLSGMYRTGNLKFNLRERLQYTYKMGEMNTYQSPRNELMLRSRLKISYEVQSKPVGRIFPWSSGTRSTPSATVPTPTQSNPGTMYCTTTPTSAASVCSRA